MGDPLTASAGIGMGASLLGGVLKGTAEQGQLEARRRADLQNQQLAEGQAADALQRGTYQAGQIRMRASQMIGQQRTGYASSGVDENTGSAAEVQAATRGMGEVDAQTAANNAMRQAWGYKVTASQYGQQAQMDKQAEGETEIGTLLGGAGQAAGNFGKLYKGTNGFSKSYGGDF